MIPARASEISYTIIDYKEAKLRFNKHHMRDEIGVRWALYKDEIRIVAQEYWKSV